MKMKNLAGFFLSLVAMVIVGCGGGGGGTPPTPVSTTVSGVAAKGPINGGLVHVFAVNADGTVQSTPLASTPAEIITDANGNYVATVAYAGPAVIQITGGSYVDEATGATVQLTSPLRAAAPNITGAVNTVNVTAASEIAVRKLTTFTAESIDAANAAVATALGFPGISLTTTAPTDPTYAFALGIFSQAMLDDPTLSLDQLLTDVSAAIDVAQGTITNPEVSNGLAATKANAFANPLINPTGTVPGVDPNEPATIAVVAAPTQGVANNQVPVTVTATVTRVGGGPVPDGTVVNFSVASGTGTLSAASATTVNGQASVVLNSTAAGTVVVMARAGTISGTVSVPFIVQPTQAIVTVATTGTLPAGTTIGGIDATVTYPTTGLSITANDVVVSGVATGSLLAANTNTVGQVILGLVSATGIQVGEFGRLTFSIAQGTFPLAGDFAIAPGATVISAEGGTVIPGISVVIQSVTLQ